MPHSFQSIIFSLFFLIIPIIVQGQAELFEPKDWEALGSMTLKKQEQQINKRADFFANQEAWDEVETLKYFAFRLLDEQGLHDEANSYLLYLGKFKERHQDYSSALDYCNQLIERGFSQEESFQAKVYSLMGRIFMQCKAPKLGLHYQKMRYNRAQTSANRDAYYIIQERGRFYIAAQEYDSARYCFLAGLAIAHKIEDAYLKIHASNDIGYSFNLAAEPDSAIGYFHQALNLLSQRASLSNRDSIIYAFVLGNLGDAFLAKNDVQQGLNYLEQEYSIFKQNREWLSAAKSMIKNISQSWDAHSNIQEKWNHLQALLLQKQLTLPDVYKKQLYEAMMKWHIKNNASSKALEMADSLYLIDQRIQLKNNQLTNEFAQGQAELELIRLSNERKLSASALENMMNQAHNERLNLYFIASLIVFGIALVALWFRKRAKNAQHQKEIEQIQKTLVEAQLKNEQLEKEKLQHDLELKKQDLTNLSLSHSRKDNLYEQILEQLKAYQKKVETNGNDAIKTTIRLVQNEIYKDETLNLIQGNIDKLNASFFNALEQQFPILTTNEIRLCSLVRLGLKNKEIALIRGISPDSVKVARRRLKKRLNLQTEDDLVAFLKQIQA